MAMLLWGLAGAVALAAVLSRRHVWLVGAGVLAVTAFVVDTRAEPAWTVAAADVPGLLPRVSTGEEWTAVGAAFTQHGLVDCTSGERLSRSFNPAGTATDAFLERLESDGVTYRAVGYGDALAGSDPSGGNTVFTLTSGERVLAGAWVVSWGEGRLFICERS